MWIYSWYRDKKVLIICPRNSNNKLWKPHRLTVINTFLRKTKSIEKLNCTIMYYCSLRDISYRSNYYILAFHLFLYLSFDQRGISENFEASYPVSNLITSYYQSTKVFMPYGVQWDFLCILCKIIWRINWFSYSESNFLCLTSWYTFRISFKRRYYT